MPNAGERVVVFPVASLVFAPVLIGGVTYYRIDPAVFLPWHDAGFLWREVKWHPKLGQLACSGAPPVAAATVGAATLGMFPALCCIWPVASGSIVIATANLVALALPIVLHPGDSVDLDGHSGDLLIAEGPQGSAGFEPFDWTAGPLQAAMGEAFSIRVSPGSAPEVGIRFSGDASFSAATLAATLGAAAAGAASAAAGAASAAAAATSSATAAARPSEALTTALLTATMVAP